MNIAINARLLLHHRLEGIGWHAYEIITRLIQKNPQHQFYLFYDRKENIIIPESKHVTAITLYPPSRHPVLIHLWCEYSLKKALKKYKIDVFYSPEILMPDKIKIPTIITVHDLSPLVMPDSIPWSHSRYYRYLIHRNLKLADHILTVSEFSKHEIISRCGIEAQKIEVVYNAARNIFKPISEINKTNIRNEFTQGNPYFISIGSIHHRKNIDKVIAAFDTYKQTYHTAHQLIIAGKFMGLHSTAKQAINQSLYKKDIICTGYIDDDRLAAYLGAADALISLSEYEGFGMPLIEAFSSGVPVIASDRSCYTEICGGAAVLVQPDRVIDIAAAMQFGLDQKVTLIEKGFSTLRKYDWDRSADKISLLINSVLQ